MNHKTLSIVTLALAALATGNVMAQNTTNVHPSSVPAKLTHQLSREDVQAELREARRTGNMVAIGDSGAKLNELFPGRYPNQVAGQTMSRDQVLSELREAQRTGNVFAIGESGAKLNELFPGNYPNQVAEHRLSREEVRADLREALRTGDIVDSGESGVKLNQLFPGSYPHKS